MRTPSYGGSLLRTCVLILAWAAGAAQAGGFTVSPVLVNFQSGQRSTAVTITNASGQPQRIQAEVMRWSRTGGEDQLEPDGKVLLNPPLFELAPGASQIVRLGFRSKSLPPTDRESSYRVFFQEIARADANDGQQLQMLLRVGIPVFVAPANPQKSLQWSLRRSGDSVQLQLDNRGNVHTRIANLRLSQAPSGVEQKAEGFVYVFAGQSQQWTLPAAGFVPGMPLLLDALTDTGNLHVELPLPQG